MITDTRLGTIDEVLAETSDELRAICLRLRAIIAEADPDAVEMPRPGDRALSYGLSERKMKDGYAYISPQRGYVNLGFYQGVDLPDPEGLLEGTGKRLRHVKVRSLADADRAAVRDLVAAAVAERRGT